MFVQHCVGDTWWSRSGGWGGGVKKYFIHHLYLAAVAVSVPSYPSSPTVFSADTRRINSHCFNISFSFGIVQKAGTERCFKAVGKQYGIKNGVITVFVLYMGEVCWFILGTVSSGTSRVRAV